MDIGLLITFGIIILVLIISNSLMFLYRDEYIKEISDLKNEIKLKDIQLSIYKDCNHSERNYLAKKFR